MAFLTQLLSQQPAVMGSFKQLPSILKIKIIDAYIAGEGYKVAKRSQVAVSSVCNIIKTWQCTGSVGQEDQENVSEGTARRISKALQEDLADCEVVVHCAATP